MNWQAEIRSWMVASAAIFALSAIGYRVATAPDLSPVVKHLDAATGAWADASAKQAASMTAIQKGIRVELWQLDRVLVDASQTLQAARGAINTANDHIAPLLDSTRAAMDSIPPAVQHVTEDSDAIRPVLAGATDTVGDVHRLLSQPELTATLSNVASVTGSAAAISADARKVSDKLTTDYLKPVPWYLWPLKRGSQLLDIGAAVARHTP